jgi:hypothetical protein
MKLFIPVTTTLLVTGFFLIKKNRYENSYHNAFCLVNTFDQL